MSEDDRDPDEELFRDAMRGVRPLRHDRRAETETRRPPPIPRQRLADERAVIAELAETNRDHGDLGPERGEELVYFRAGLPRRVLRKLRRGEFSIIAELDLHGMTVATAKGALGDFLTQCRQRELHCVRIVHGKGRRSRNDGPVLKAKVDHWLRRRDDVLAFCSARPVDGGTGAVYVLLR